LASRVAAVGSSVVGGAFVAVMGDTGNVTAKHLHFELRRNGVAVDPAPYFTSAAGGGITPIREDDMGAPKLVKKTEGGTEWMLIHPALKGPGPNQEGYVVTS